MRDEWTPKYVLNGDFVKRDTEDIERNMISFFESYKRLFKNYIEGNGKVKKILLNSQIPVAVELMRLELFERSRNGKN